MVHVVTITPHRLPSVLTPAQREAFADKFEEVVLMMSCELRKGEPWDGPREVWIP